MYIALTVTIVILSVLLTLLVLVQNSKGGGLASGFAGGNQIMGVRKTTETVEKLTWGFAGAVVFLSILAALSLTGQGNSTAEQSQISDHVATELPAAPVVPNALGQEAQTAE